MDTATDDIKVEDYTVVAEDIKKWAMGGGGGGAQYCTPMTI